MFHSGLPVPAATTTTTAPIATAANPMSRPRMRSPKNLQATNPTTIGWRAPITVALTMVVSLTAEKKSATSRPRAIPPAAVWRMMCHDTRTPRAHIHATRSRA